MTSKKFSAKYDTDYHNIYDTELLTTKSRKTERKQHLIYFHGGAYILGRNGFKRNESFISSLIEATGAKVTFVDYPVAPESKFDQTMEKV